MKYGSLKHSFFNAIKLFDKRKSFHQRNANIFTSVLKLRFLVLFLKRTFKNKTFTNKLVNEMNYDLIKKVRTPNPRTIYF